MRHRQREFYIACFRPQWMWLYIKCNGKMFYHFCLTITLPTLNYHLMLTCTTFILIKCIWLKVEFSQYYCYQHTLVVTPVEQLNHFGTVGIKSLGDNVAYNTIKVNTRTIYAFNCTTFRHAQFRDFFLQK